jgi:hypothetical protein
MALVDVTFAFHLPYTMTNINNLSSLTHNSYPPPLVKSLIGIKDDDWDWGWRFLFLSIY